MTLGLGVLSFLSHQHFAPTKNDGHFQVRNLRDFQWSKKIQGQTVTHRKFNIAPENGWLEDSLPFGNFSGATLNFGGVVFRGVGFNGGSCCHCWLGRHFAAGKFEVYNGQIEVRFCRMKSPVARARLNR